MKNKSRLNLDRIEQNAYYIDNKINFLLLKDIVENHPYGYFNILIPKTSIDTRSIEIKKLTAWIDDKLPLLRDNFYTINTKCYWILHGLSEFPKCKTCGKNDKFKMMNISPFQSYPQYCSSKCSNGNQNVQIKKNETTKKNYGVEHPAQSAIVRKRMRKTMKNKTGCEYALQTEHGQMSFKKTSIKKYGVDHPIKNDNVYKKQQQTCLERYGHINFGQGDIKEKVNETNLKRYDSIYPTQNDKVQEKTRNTIREKYGYDCVLQVPEIKEKIQQTNIAKYGAPYPNQNSEFRKKTQKRYFYDGRNFDSAPEIALYIWLIDNKIPFEYQPNISFSFLVNGKEHKYFPDFNINGTIVEIKGSNFLAEDGTWINPFTRKPDEVLEAKHQCCIANNVHIMYSSEYQKYIEYVNRIYGKNYIRQFKRNKVQYSYEIH